jgi:hypothetical protein
VKAQRGLSNNERAQESQPQHAGARLRAKLTHLAGVTAGSDGIAVAARRTHAGFIRHAPAQDNCFAVFALCVARNPR